MTYEFQEWLDFWYPKEDGWFVSERSRIKKLNLTNKKLWGSLIIEDWEQLEEINCGHNWLKSLVIRNCPNLKRVWVFDSLSLNSLVITNCGEINYLDASDNWKLTNWDFLTNLDKEKLIHLRIGRRTSYSSWQNSKSLFSTITQFKNLEALWINDNDFSESLKPLQSCEKLKLLGIRNTKFASGLEYLPESLETIWYDYYGKLAEKLKDYRRGNHCYDYQAWRKDNQELIFNATEIKQWKKLGLNSGEYLIAKQWKDKGFTNVEQVREWIEIGFSKNQSDKAKEWVDLGYNSQQVKEWNELGLSLDEHLIAEQWKIQGFDIGQAREWIKLGLSLDEHELASYLKKNNLTCKEFVQWNNLGLKISDHKLIIYLKKESYDPTTFATELKKHKILFKRGSYSNYPILFQRWKKANEKLLLQIQQQSPEEQLKQLEIKKTESIKNNTETETPSKEPKEKSLSTELLEDYYSKDKLEIQLAEEKSKNLLLLKQIQELQKDLKEVKNKRENSELIQDLLETQEQLTKLRLTERNSSSIPFTKKQLDRVKQRLNESLDSQKIEKICQLQNELIELEVKNELLQKPDEEYFQKPNEWEDFSRVGDRNLQIGDSSREEYQGNIEIPSSVPFKP